jgi:hypothetical protein
MEEFDKAFDQPMNFFTTYNPDIIEADLVQMLKGYKIEPTVNKNKYKIKFKQEGTHEHVAKPWNLEICIRILKVSDEMNCVEFTKLNGPQD